MRLKSIRVQNFRCLENCSFNLRDFTTLIGQNNAGKSSLLRAIVILLNQEKPKPEEWRKGHEGEEIVIEGCFDEIQDYERRVPGIAGIVQNNEVKLRVIATLSRNDKGEQTVTTRYEAFMCEEVIEGIEENWAAVPAPLKTVAGEVGITTGDKWKTKNGKELIKQTIRDNHPEMILYSEPAWTGQGISIPPALKQALPQAVLIEAVKDASEDTKPASKTTFGTLLNKLILPAIIGSDEYGDFQKAVRALDARIRGNGVDKLESVRQLEQDLYARMSSIIESRAVVTLDPPDTEKFIGGSASIKIDDGTETPVYLQGHGVQRALVFALIEVLAKQTARVAEGEDGERQRATLLLFEEPELYIHPHLMRRLKKALVGISASPNWQVIISTHSPFLIDVATDPQSLIILRRTGGGCPDIMQLDTDPFEGDAPSKRDQEALRAALDFHPTVTEAFFATKVVLVEGDTEVAVFRHTDRLLPLAGIPDCNADNTTIVSCGGKWTIPAMARLLRKFRIPYRVIHDRDRQNKTDEELAQVAAIHPYRSNDRIREIAGDENVFVVDDTFEHLFEDGDEVPSSAKPYRAWKKAQEICEGVQNLDHVPRLREVIHFAFNW